MKNLSHIALNLNQGIVHNNTDTDTDTGNTVKAIYDTHVGIIVILPECQEYKDKIIATIPSYIAEKLTIVKSGNSFSVDTWDSTIREQSVQNRLDESN